jgi:hypothetical protein
MMKNEPIMNIDQQLHPLRHELLAFYNRLDANQRSKWQNYWQELVKRDFQEAEIIQELNSLSEKHYRQLITYTRLLLWA